MRSVAITALCVLAATAYGRVATAQETWPEAYSRAMLGKLGGAHLARDLETRRVTRVALVNVGPTDAALALAGQLPAVTELEVLAMPYQDFSDVGLRSIRGLRNLTHVQIVGARITDAGTANLSGMNQLEQVSIDAPVSDGALAALAGKPQLRLLDLYGTRVSGNGLANLAGSEALQFLCLDRTPTNDVGLSYIGQMTSLRTLLLRQTRITDAGMTSLLALQNLERLYLDGTRISAEGLAGLTGSVDPTLMTFVGAAQLRELSLRGAPNLDGRNLSAVANLYGLPYLRKLDLAETPLVRNQAAVQQLARAEQIAEHWRNAQGIGSVGPILRFDENLNVSGMYFIAPAFAPSAGILDELELNPPATLQELSLREAYLRNNDLRRLANLTNLRRLNLYKTRIGDQGLQLLHGLTNLQQIILDDDNDLVSPEGEAAFKEAVPTVEFVRIP